MHIYTCTIIHQCMHIHLSLFASSRGIAPCLEDWLRIHCVATAPACPAEPKCNCSISGRAEIGATAGTDGPSLDWHNHKKSQHVAATQVLVLMSGIGNPSEIYGQNSIYLTVNWWLYSTYWEISPSTETGNSVPRPSSWMVLWHRWQLAIFASHFFPIFPSQLPMLRSWFEFRNIDWHWDELGTHTFGDLWKFGFCRVPKPDLRHFWMNHHQHMPMHQKLSECISIFQTGILNCTELPCSSIFQVFWIFLDGMSRSSSIWVTRSLSSKAADSDERQPRGITDLGAFPRCCLIKKGEGIIIYKMNSYIYLCIVSCCVHTCDTTLDLRTVYIDTYNGYSNYACVCMWDTIYIYVCMYRYDMLVSYHGSLPEMCKTPYFKW